MDNKQITLYIRSYLARRPIETHFFICICKDHSIQQAHYLFLKCNSLVLWYAERDEAFAEKALAALGSKNAKILLVRLYLV